MAGPWERYGQTQAQPEPWARYQQQNTVQPGDGATTRASAMPLGIGTPTVFGTPSERHPYLQRGLVDNLTGNVEREDLPELGTKQAPDQATGLKLLAGYLFSASPEQITQIAEEALPGATVRNDKNGNPIIKFQGQEFYINKPGFSEADMVNFAGALIAYAPAGKLSSLVPSWLLRIPVAGAGGTATSIAVDKGMQMLGADEGPDYERALLVGGVNAAMSPLARVTQAGQSSNQLREASRAAYQAAEQAGIAATPQSFATAARTVQNAINQSGFDAQLHPRAARVLARFQEEAAAGQPLTLQRLEILRRVAEVARDSADPSEANIGRTIVRSLDDYVQRLTPAQVTANPQNIQRAVAALNEARRLWGVRARSDTVESLIRRAELDAEKVGWEQALRTAFRTIAIDEDEMARFGRAEQEAIRDIVRGSGNALRLVRKFSNTTKLGAAVGGGVTGYAMGGLPGAAAGAGGGVGAGMAISEGARELAGQIAYQKAQDLLQTIRGGGVIQVPWLAGAGAQSVEARQ